MDLKGRPYNLPKKYKNGAESLVVRMGCVLQVFNIQNCIGTEKFLFIAPWNRRRKNFAVKDLDDSLTKQFGIRSNKLRMESSSYNLQIVLSDNNIECVRCYCYM